MASRRTGLFGASEDERESRLNQQRDYAAQLQEQVRIKNARAEQDKARRLQEQQQERELMDFQQHQQQQGRRLQAQQATVSQPPPLQQQQQQQQQPHLNQSQQNQPHSPPRSPQRHPPHYSQQNQSLEPEVQHGSAILNASPTKQWGYNPPPVGDVFNYPTSSYSTPSSLAFSAGVAATPLVSTFTPSVSIFDSMLQPETSSSDVTNQIDALRVLRLEMETSWKQRRLALQSIETKPCFILPPSPTASTRIPLSQDEKRLLDDDIDLTSRPHTPEEPELTSNNPGLFGDSVLIPLFKAPATQPKPSPRPVASSSSSAASPPRTPSAVHRRLAAAVSAAAAVESEVSCLDSNALRHDSELLHFDE